MKLLSDLLDTYVVYISKSSHFATADLGRLLAQHGAIVSLTVNSRVRYSAAFSLVALN